MDSRESFAANLGYNKNISKALEIVEAASM